MDLILRLPDAIARDDESFATIFVPPGEDRVYKLSRRSRSGHANLDATARAVFAAERGAYERLRSYPDLAKHAPHYYGVVTVADVLDLSGASVAARYVLDCCLVLERLAGEDRKVPCLPNNAAAARAREVLRRFREVGILFVGDASAFGWDDPEGPKLIDFGLRDAAGEHGWE